MAKDNIKGDPPANAPKFWTDDIFWKYGRPKIELGDPYTIRSYMSWMHLYFMGHFTDPVRDQVYLSKLFQYFIVNCPRIDEEAAGEMETLMFDSVKSKYAFKGEEIIIEMDEELKREPEVIRNQTVQFQGNFGRLISAEVNDRKYREFYLNEKNLIRARIRFGVICLTLLRAPSKNVESSLRTLNENLPNNWGVMGLYRYCSKFPLITRRFVESFVRFSEEDPNMICRPLRTFIEYMGATNHGYTTISVFKFTVEWPLEWYGLFLYRHYLALHKIERKFREWIFGTKDKNLIGHLNKIDEYCVSWLEYREGKQYDLVNYSRLFDPDIFGELSSAKNPELASLFAGMIGDKDAVAEVRVLKRFRAFEKYFDLGLKLCKDLKIGFNDKEFYQLDIGHHSQTD